jgi:uncharacterized protein (DUF58 family)
LIDTSFLKELDRFNMILKKRVLSKYQGERESHSKGEGLLFADYKDYVPGDDFRHIDWTVYARTGKFYVKQFEEERNMTVHIIVDSSSSMDYGKSISKFEYSSMIGLGFAYMALKNNEKFNFSTFSNRLNYLKAKKGLNQLMGIVDRLEKMRVSGNSEFKTSLDEYKRFVKSKSFIILISDFLYDIEEIKQVLRRYGKHEVLAIQVLDPKERKLSLFGDVVLEDSETKNRIRTFISGRLLKGYQDRIEKHIAAVKDACEKQGHDFVTVTTDHPIFETFFETLKT